MSHVKQRNFLLTPTAKALSLSEALRLNEDEAHFLFLDIRWSWTDGIPVCPRCDNEKLYLHKRDRAGVYTCAKCHHQFSETSGTPFASRKTAFKNLLALTSFRIHGGCSLLSLTQELGINYRGAFERNKQLAFLRGNIVPAATTLRWPFLSPVRKANEHSTLIEAVANATRGLPDQVRGDVAQDMILGVLSGDVAPDDLLANIKKYIRKYYRSYDNRFVCLSWDQPVPGTDAMRFDEIISVESVEP